MKQPRRAALLRFFFVSGSKRTRCYTVRTMGAHASGRSRLRALTHHSYKPGSPAFHVRLNVATRCERWALTPPGAHASRRSRQHSRLRALTPPGARASERSRLRALTHHSYKPGPPAPASHIFKKSLRCHPCRSRVAALTVRVMLHTSNHSSNHLSCEQTSALSMQSKSKSCFSSSLIDASHICLWSGQSKR